MTTAQWIEAFPDAPIATDRNGFVVLANRRAEGTEFPGGGRRAGDVHAQQPQARPG